MSVLVAHSRVVERVHSRLILPSSDSRCLARTVVRGHRVPVRLATAGRARRATHLWSWNRLGIRTWDARGWDTTALGLVVRSSGRRRDSRGILLVLDDIRLRYRSITFVRHFLDRDTARTWRRAGWHVGELDLGDLWCSPISSTDLRREDRLRVDDDPGWHAVRVALIENNVPRLDDPARRTMQESVRPLLLAVPQEDALD
ncbi:hypothetical protein C8T65DRAFT_654186, partial [Cerioporus squamosus]